MVSPILRYSNVAATAMYLTIGGLIARALVGDVHHEPSALNVALAMVPVFLAANALNFFLIAISRRIVDGREIQAQVRSSLVPLLPAQLAAAAIAAVLAGVYVTSGTRHCSG